MKKILFILVILNCGYSCINKKYRDKSFYAFSFQDSLTMQVITKDTSKKGIILNDSVVVYQDLPLIYEKHEPKWIFKNAKKEKGIKGEVLLVPEISQVDPPFTLIKQKYNNTIVIIKEKDTLLFDYFKFEMLDLGIRM